MSAHEEQLAAIQRQMQRAGVEVAKAARGNLVKWGVGLDPGVADPRRRWWARAHLRLGRHVRPLTVAEYPSGPEAAEALAEAVDRYVTNYHRKQRRR